MTKLADLRFRALTIPFRQQFAHASATRASTSSLWIEAVTTQGAVGFGEGCPRDYVTGETLNTARIFFDEVRSEVLANICDAPSLKNWVSTHSARIDRNPAAWCAIELALIDALSREAGQSAEAWLGLPETAGRFQYTAVLGDAAPKAFAATFARYCAAGFVDYKLKLSGDLGRDRGKLAVLSKADSAVERLRLDANNLWPDVDSAITWLAALAAPAFAIEEPLKVEHASELPRIARALNLAIILDESFTRLHQLDALDTSTRWIANLRISKHGGLLRTLEIVSAARARGVQLIVGAQVGETSLLTRVGLIVAQAAGGALIAQEGAFGTQLLMQDVINEPLMFGPGGKLAFESSGLGWGLVCVPNSDWLDA